MKAFWLSFLIFFSSASSLAKLKDNEVIKEYKESFSAVRPDLYSNIHKTSNEYWKDWNSFESYILDKQDIHEKQGLGYMISGALMTVLTSIGYAQADSATQEITYSLAQSLSIGAIGYGAYQYYIGDQDRSFYYIVNSTEGLSSAQRDQFVSHYSAEKRYQKDRLKTITMITYGLIAAANLINASQAEDETTKDVLYSLGGVYTLAFLSVTF
tara:strand:- start:15582 stop:16217 length:636 start_codon:yes stop_codon:yes gene_type:complete